MNRLTRSLSPLLVLLFSALLVWLIMANRPEPTRRKAPENPVSVEVTTVAPQSYIVRLRSRGVVTPRRETTLVAQVAGVIREVSPRYQVGERFAKGEWLLRIDPRDYRIAVTLAESRLAQARLRLAQEEARAEQARRDWERLGEPGKPSELTLRIPQLRSERAAVAAAEAELEKARLDLQRTRIRAPYAAQLVEKRVDVGQFVTPGTPVALIQEVERLEVRLPLTSRQLAFLPLTEKPAVTLSWTAGPEMRTWPARILRAEGVVDPGTQQRFVVAELEKPAKKGDPPPSGQFVEAAIEGRRLDEVLVIPNGAVRAGNAVFVVDDRNLLRRRELTVIWRDETHTVARPALEPGDRLVTSPVVESLLGRRVTIAGERP